MHFKIYQGNGYILKIIMIQIGVPKEMTNLVLKSVPGSILDNISGLKVSYILPKIQLNKIAHLFKILESDKSVESFEISVSTIERVFFRFQIVTI